MLYKEIDFPYICPITKREFNSGRGLSIYLTKTLKVDHSEYYDKYIHHRDPSCFFCGAEKGTFISVSRGYRNLCDSEECKRKSFASHTVEGIMYREQISREEAEKRFEVLNNQIIEKRMETADKLRTEDPLWDSKRSHNSKHFWIEKGYSEEEAEKRAYEVMKMIHRKTVKKRIENPENYHHTYTTRLEYYLHRGMDEREAKKALSERQLTFSKEICVEKYGKKRGLEMWENRQKRWLETLDSKSDEEKREINRKKLMSHKGVSAISQKLFWSIYNNIEENDEIRFEELNSEIIRYDNVTDKHYKYDFCDHKTKKIIEFNGDFWHCNPEKYNETYIHPFLKVTAKELWQKDMDKINWAKRYGYDLLTIWESDYRKNPKAVLEKCINFLDIHCS